MTPPPRRRVGWIPPRTRTDRSSLLGADSARLAAGDRASTYSRRPPKSSRQRSGRTCRRRRTRTSPDSGGLTVLQQHVAQRNGRVDQKAPLPLSTLELLPLSKPELEEPLS